MGTDFLPRLSAAVSDSGAVNRLVNEQTVVALLIGIPGVVGTICFAPLLMPVFYASNFGPAAELLKWLAVGVFGRLISWPLSFLLMAKGDSRFLWTNVIATLTQLSALWVGLPRLGLNACGYVTILSFAVFTLVNLIAARSLTGFRWSRDAWQVIGLGFLALGMTGAGFLLVPAPWGFAPGAVVFLVSCFWGYRRLCHLTQIPLVGRLLGRLKRQAA
jgi:PST family polysaccharide transporter